MNKNDSNNQAINISTLPVEPKSGLFLFPVIQPQLHVQHTRWIEIPEIIDGKDGILSVAEDRKNIPFSIKRVYYIYNLQHHKHVQRGKHAHKTLEQVLFCINGSCKLTLHDGTETQEVSLFQPNAGIYLGPRVWHVMHTFEDNCILLVLASDFFNEEDYIRNYDDYLEHLHRH
jgi:WxcM-like, C-terminal